MQGSVFIIFGAVLVVMMILQGLTILNAKHFALSVRDIKRDVERLKRLINNLRTKIKRMNKDEDDKCYIPENIYVPKKDTPFNFVKNYDPAFVSYCIQKEHIQTIALVLSYLKPDEALPILQCLPPDLQSDVLQRIACMGCTTPEIVHIVERVLKQCLESRNAYNDYHHIVDGIESSAKILGYADRVSGKQIMEAMKKETPELAKEIKKRIFVIEDIVMLDDRSIQKVMREVDSQELAKALKSVGTEVHDKVFRNMSTRAAEMIKADMEYMGPMRLKEVEKAQQKVVSIILYLEDSGEIVTPRYDDEMHCTGKTETMTRAEMNDDKL